MKVFTTPNRYILAGIMMLSVLISCNEDEFEQATVTFYPTLEAETTEPSAGTNGVPTVVRLRTSRVLARESQVNIRISGEGAGYGFSYTTFPPQLKPGIVTITIPANSTEGSFTFTPRNDGIFAPFNYNYTFSIEGASESIRSIGQGTYNMKVLDSTSPFIDLNFNDCSSSPGVTEQIVSGANVMQVSTWACTPFGYPNETTNAIEANAFGKNSPGSSNSYLILPVINGDDYNTLFVSMLVYSRFSGPGQIKVRYSNNYPGTGNPEAQDVTWNDLDELNNKMPTAGSRQWIPVNGFINNVSGSSFYVAIQFIGGTSASSANWRVENLEIKGN